MSTPEQPKGDLLHLIAMMTMRAPGARLAVAAATLSLVLGALAVAAPSAGGSPATSRPIPAGFPLLAGYPSDDSAENADYGRTGPSRHIKPLRFMACQHVLRTPPGVDHLRGGWANPEDYRERQLSVFASRAEAQGFVDSISDLYLACRHENTEDGYTTVRSVRPSDAGDSAFTMITHYRFDGAPAIGLASDAVVRVGRAVLVSATYGEGGGGPHPAVETRRASRQALAAIRPLIRAMSDLH